MARREKLKISKRLLARFVKQNKTTRFIAGYFKISERTIYRKIKQHGLRGIRKHGRKPFVKEIPVVEKPRLWIPTKEYIDSLTRIYRFQNIQYPVTKYVNARTRVCSNAQHNPKGKFTTCTIYYVALESKLFFLYPIQIRYSEKGVSFNEIYHYFSNNAIDILRLRLEPTGIEVIDIVAFHFTFKTGEPQAFIGYTDAFRKKDIHSG